MIGHVVLLSWMMLGVGSQTEAATAAKVDRIFGVTWGMSPKEVARAHPRVTPSAGTPRTTAAPPLESFNVSDTLFDQKVELTFGFYRNRLAMIMLEAAPLADEREIREQALAALYEKYGSARRVGDALVWETPQTKTTLVLNSQGDPFLLYEDASVISAIDGERMALGEKEARERAARASSGEERSRSVLWNKDASGEAILGVAWGMSLRQVGAVYPGVLGPFGERKELQPDPLRFYVAEVTLFDEKVSVMFAFFRNRLALVVLSPPSGSMEASAWTGKVDAALDDRIGPRKEEEAPDPLSFARRAKLPTQRFAVWRTPRTTVLQCPDAIREPDLRGRCGDDDLMFEDASVADLVRTQREDSAKRRESDAASTQRETESRERSRF